MKTSHLFASLVLAAGLLSGCSKPAPAPTEAPAAAVSEAPAPAPVEAAPAPAAEAPAEAPTEATSASAPADVPPAQ